MTVEFSGIGADALRALADALESGRLGSPFSVLSIQRLVPPLIAAQIAKDLSACTERGAGPSHLSLTLRLLAAERERAERAADHVELVWSGPEVPGAGSRDTAVVVRELFESAQRSVLVSGYAVYQGKRVFRALAENFDRSPDLRVRMFLNVHRDSHDDRPDSELTREFAERFRHAEWPGQRLPEVFYDPRALSRDSGPRSCLHAKCIVVDGERALVTSANFTEAAQERNIEAGILVGSREFARGLSAQFETLIVRGELRWLAGLG